MHTFGGADKIFKRKRIEAKPKKWFSEEFQNKFNLIRTPVAHQSPIEPAARMIPAISSASSIYTFSSRYLLLII